MRSSAFRRKLDSDERTCAIPKWPERDITLVLRVRGVDVNQP